MRPLGVLREGTGKVECHLFAVPEGNSLILVRSRFRISRIPLEWHSKPT